MSVAKCLTMATELEDQNLDSLIIPGIEKGSDKMPDPALSTTESGDMTTKTTAGDSSFWHSESPPSTTMDESPDGCVMRNRKKKNLENCSPNNVPLISNKENNLNKNARQEEEDDSSSSTTSDSKKKHQKNGSWIHRRPRVSRMDTADENSQVCKSEFRGFINLFYIFGLIYILVNPVYKFYETGVFIDPSLANRMFDDVALLMSTWAGCTVWSFIAFILFRLYLSKKINYSVLLIVQHLTQFSVVASCTTLVLFKKWAVFPSFFICVIGAIYSMKMHSYISSCLDFHENGPPESAKDCFPECLTFNNFVYYLVAPVLVYEISYPRTTEFRIKYFLSKLNHMFISFMMMYLVVSYSIVPIVTESYKHPFVHTAARLVGPLLVMDFLCFYFLFECICNLFAEITGFADRDFYEDWWNSTNWDEYARKWNKPVHQFLSRHVYYASHRKLNFTKQGSTAVTFFFSAIIHEVILAVTFRLPRFYILVLMLCQIPLIQFGRWMKKRSDFGGNLFFWIGIILGVPLLGVCYGREMSAAWAGASSNYESLRIF